MIRSLKSVFFDRLVWSFQNTTPPSELKSCLANAERRSKFKDGVQIYVTMLVSTVNNKKTFEPRKSWISYWSEKIWRIGRHVLSNSTSVLLFMGFKGSQVIVLRSAQLMSPFLVWGLIRSPLMFRQWGLKGFQVISPSGLVGIIGTNWANSKGGCISHTHTHTHTHTPSPSFWHVKVLRLP